MENRFECNAKMVDFLDDVFLRCQWYDSSVRVLTLSYLQRIFCRVK